MKREVSGRQHKMSWSTRRGGRDHFVTTSIRDYPVTTADNIVKEACSFHWMPAVCSMQQRAFQVHETYKTRTRLISTTAATRGRVASQVYLARGHVVTDVIDVFPATNVGHAGRRGAQSDQKVRQSPEIAEVYLQLTHDHGITIGDLNMKKVLHRKQGTTATSVNVDHSSENGTHGTLEAVDTDAAVDSSWVSVHTEDRRHEPCGLGPLPGLQPPRLPGFPEWLPAKWFPMHHPGPATTSPLMRGHPLRGLHTQTPCMTSSREIRLTLSPAPVQRYDREQPLATPGWCRVGTQVTPGRVVARNRDIAAVLQNLRRGGRCMPSAHGTPGRRYGVPLALRAPQLKVPAGPQYMCSSSSAVVVVIVGVVVVLGRGETVYDVTRLVPIAQFPVLADREATRVMRLRPPTPRHTTARRECKAGRVPAAMVTTSTT
ncbi:hypothetical protein HPB51_007931 [Rhipicephalus microplus]|uniref:Uncharacterized protein n=1 Tax=Rhipicephalus microplus TaxID=6941 RepID=A0A9J6EN74_RHIMP|nr:hypothetical protein HPB51_007931 [Rhipicephalus microplus]